MPSSIKIPVVDSLIVTAEAAWETVDGRDEMNTPFIIARVVDQHGAIIGLVGADFQVVQMGLSSKQSASFHRLP